MGFIFSKAMNENLKSQQEFMLMNSRLQVCFLLNSVMKWIFFFNLEIFLDKTVKMFCVDFCLFMLRMYMDGKSLLVLKCFIH